jgi:hypothetical protein
MMERGHCMASNGDRFERAYNMIDALLRKRVGGAKTLSFSAVVNEAARKDATVHVYKDELLEYGDLRNAIVKSGSTSLIEVTTKLGDRSKSTHR